MINNDGKAKDILFNIINNNGHYICEFRREKMKLEEYKKYVHEVNNNIENLLKDNEEELNFYQLLVKTFNQVCEERNNLEQTLDEIEKYIENHKRKSETRIYGLEIPEFIFNGNIEDIEEIIKKAKGDDK